MAQDNNPVLNIKNSTLDLAPIVLFVYNRPDHTRQTVEALQKNKLVDKSELFIYSDAAKNENDVDKVDVVREYLTTIDGFKKVTIIERDQNWGLANSIIDGVTKVIKEYGKIIVLEDDLVTSPYFLEFMNDGLEFYKDEKKVFGITGYAFPVKKENLNSTFFLKDEGCWSWATWDNKWKYFEKNTDKLIATFTKDMIKDFNFENSSDLWSQVLQNKKGEINTWAIYWYATVYLNDGLFLHPRDSFAQNIGHDGSGFHCGKNNNFDTPIVRNYNVNFEVEIKESDIAKLLHIEYFNSLKIPISKRIFNKIKRAILEKNEHKLSRQKLN